MSGLQLDFSKIDWAIVTATIAGPILAVQAQKIVERSRERRNQKSWVFQRLMATRNARVSPDHVQALNMIALAFYGRRIFGLQYRSRSETTVLDAWSEYHHHLSQRPADGALTVWAVDGDKLFTSLLAAIAKNLGYQFDRVQLQSGGYSPVAHGELEQQQEVLRKLAIAVLGGDQPLKMNVTAFPVDAAAAQAQRQLAESMSAALTGKGSLSVTVEGDDKPDSSSPKT